MTRDEALSIRKALDGFVTKVVNSPAEINENLSAIRVWVAGVFIVDDVRLHEGIPFKCVQAHDSTHNPAWNPADNPALWMQYHGTSPETARPWIAPTGAHDVYKVGEFMIWTDGAIYECLSNTNFSPAEYGQAWKKEGEE